MPASEAQVRANRQNALKSSGPKTPEGKARSRANSYKHGLSGEGIVLPNEDAEEFDRRFATIVGELKPKNEVARQLASRVALLTVKLDRSAEHEAKAISFRMRKATAEFDDARLAEVENYYAWLAAEPATNARRLRSTPEGIDRLLDAFEGLRFDLTHPEGMRWDWAHCELLHHLMGRRMMEIPVSRAKAFSDAMNGDFKHLYPSDGAGLDPVARKKWAFESLVTLIDEQIAKLNTLREGMELEGLALDRAEAASRAIFDPSPEAILARKYEAANERTLLRILKEFREIQTIEPEPFFESRLGDEPAEELGSFLPDPPDENDPEPIIDPTEEFAEPEVEIQAIEVACERKETGSTTRRRASKAARA